MNDHYLCLNSLSKLHNWLTSMMMILVNSNHSVISYMCPNIMDMTKINKEIQLTLLSFLKEGSKIDEQTRK